MPTPGGPETSSQQTKSKREETKQEQNASSVGSDIKQAPEYTYTLGNNHPGNILFA